jgi:Ice-binding-like
VKSWGVLLPSCTPLRFKFTSGHACSLKGELLKKFSVFLLSAVCSFGQTSVPLGTSANFAILAGSAITNTGPSAITGNIGVSPSLAITGFPPGTVTGAMDAGGGTAAQAQADLTLAYNHAVAEVTAQDITGQDLGGLTLTPGIYHFDSSAQMTGTLTLDGLGNANSIFVFQIGSTLTTASNAIVAAINGAQAANIFWQVGSSATLGTGTAFIGNILALTSITADTSASVAGRLLALNGAVTLDTNVIGRPPLGPLGPSPTPAPSSWVLLLIGLFFAILYQTRARWLRAIKQMG